MRKLLKTILLGLALIAAPAQATNYFAAPTGSDTNDGLSAGAPKTITWYLNNATSGDIIYLLDGTYPASQTNQSGEFAHLHGGTHGARVTYIGDILNPAAVTLEAPFKFTHNVYGELHGNSYCTLKGVKAESIELAGYTNSPPQQAMTDSIVYCIADSGFSTGRADSCVIAYNTIGSGGSANGFSMGEQAAHSFHNKIIGNTLVLGLGSGGSLTNITNLNRLDGTTISQNRVRTRQWAGASTTIHANTWFGLRNSMVSDNYFSIRNDITSTEMYFLNLRDSTAFNTFVRDTFLVDTLSTGVSKIKFSTSGALPGTTQYNTFDHCVFKVNGDLGYQDIANGDVHQFNQYVSKRPFTVSTGNAASDSVTMMHNTFLVDDATVIDMPFDSTSAYKPTNWRLISNIFMCRTGGNGTHVRNNWHTGWGLRDTNLVFGEAGDTQNAYDRPAGTGDLVKQWGDPEFVNSRWETFDLTPSATGPAKVGVWADGYVGAIVPPAAPVVVTITTTALANARVDAEYSRVISVTGGTGPYTWAVTAGALPNGLTIGEFNGVVAGIPTTVGTSVFTVSATDDLLAVDTQELQITVNSDAPLTPRRRWFWWW